MIQNDKHNLCNVIFSQILLQQDVFFMRFKYLPNQCICLSIGIRVFDSVDNSLRHIHHLMENKGIFQVIWQTPDTANALQMLITDEL